ncbi:hypothetical protein [Paenibacillus sedimenti]|uniref:Uncharacterized protein n=1 Tax=Paenibacillus sedimenti TaxID=2770274 RepID=A0A926QLA1_9BACL|nr:hypothetical protein [Paenibacillus sedimenti]MBD0382633.1 hypothetical protein [Paenibacillus sedimenti]
MKLFLKLFKFFLRIFAISFALVFSFTALQKIELGQRIGKGLFYLKGYYEDSEMVGGELRTKIVTEQGPGNLMIPLFVGLLITIIYIVYLTIKAKQGGRT